MPNKNNNKGYIFDFHEGFMTWYQLKDENAKQLLVDNGGSEILFSPRSRDFRHGPLRYARIFFIAICSPCDVCCCWYLHLPHKIIYFLCPILIPNYCRPRFCVNFIDFTGFHFHCTDCNGYQNLFRLTNMCWYFLLNPRIAKLCCCTGILWNHAREIKPYIRY